MSRFDTVRRLFLATGASVALGLFSTGCMIGVGLNGFDLVEEDRLYEEGHIEGSGLAVHTENGGVTITRGGDEVRVLATLKARTAERLAETLVVLERDSDGLLKIYPKWPNDTRKGSEGCSFEITIPSVYGVTVDTANGAIKIDGLAGEANLETSNGRIEVRGHDGTVDAHTSNGRVILVQIMGDIVARTSNGRIEAEQINGVLDAKTSNGSIDVRLAPEATGPVQLRTSNGSVRLEVGTAFEGRLTFKASRGSIRIPGQGGVVAASSSVKTSGRREATLEFKEQGQESRVTTSNGSIIFKLTEN